MNAIEPCDDIGSDNAGSFAEQTCCHATLEAPDDVHSMPGRLGVAQKAVRNLLDDFRQNKLQFADLQSALIKILQDAEGERTQLESTQRAMLNILEDAAELAQNLADARDQAEEANRAKSRFLAGISHELRTPLHGILGYAELLSLEGGLSTAQSERVAAMIAAGEHLLGTINAVLDLSQIEADKVELRPEEIDLTELARVCLDVIRPAAEAKGLAVNFTTAGLLHLYADPTRLRQVLINLLGNATKFTSAGSIELRQFLTEAGACIRLEVADTGPGIRAQHYDKLFQTFERLNANAVSGIEGAGLGLAISARLVTLMGGRIGHHDNPGGGSVFWLELPANRTPAVTDTADATVPDGAGIGLRVLVVDDEPLNRNIASGFLRHGGHDVVEVDNGAEAVELAAARDFDVILMDVRLPGMNGLEATRLIRTLPSTRSLVPVVAVTAQAFPEQIEICRQAGMDTHVAKPFTRATLLAAVAKVAQTSGPAVFVAEPPDIPPASAAVEIPVFDRNAFDDSTEVLSAEEIAKHLQTLIARCEHLAAKLSAPGLLGRSRDLADSVHGLAGSASMLGFLALGHIGRRFEAAGAADVAALASELIVAIDAAVAVLRRDMAGAMATIT